MKTYRTGFLLALVGNIVLAVVLAGLLFHYRVPKPIEIRETQTTIPVAQPSMTSPQEATEALLAPLQISPQRWQTIGVETGKVERKLVQDEIQTTGNVAVDETKLAYVQVRFSGYIEKV